MIAVNPQGSVSLSRLTLTDFRCYASLRLDLDPTPAVFTGPNGAGKTNLLEAVSFLAPGRGLRQARLIDPVRVAGDAAASGWAVAARARTADGDVDLGTGVSAADRPANGDRRTVRVAGETASNQAALAEHLSVHWLTPQMDRLFIDGASGRRRFLDRLVFGSDPAHVGRVNAYEKALRERQRLLREHDRADPAWLAALEDTMAAKGVAIAAARSDLVANLSAVCVDGLDPFPGAGIAVDGEVEGWLDEAPALACEDRFRQRLATARGRDAEQGRTGAGPHRSDLRVSHLVKGCTAETCSTGEQKALLIALVLGNASMQAAGRGLAPILLLDEVAAHLDQTRRGALFEWLADIGVQAWLTGTDASTFETLSGRAQFFRIEEAAVTAVA